MPSQKQVCLPRATPRSRTAHTHSLVGTIPSRSPGLGPLFSGTPGIRSCLPRLPRLCCTLLPLSTLLVSRRWNSSPEAWVPGLAEWCVLVKCFLLSPHLGNDGDGWATIPVPTAYLFCSDGENFGMGNGPWGEICWRDCPLARSVWEGGLVRMFQ